MANGSLPPRRWRKWLVAAIILGLVLLLYPQLRDFGGELYRAFS